MFYSTKVIQKTVSKKADFPPLWSDFGQIIRNYARTPGGQIYKNKENLKF